MIYLKDSIHKTLVNLVNEDVEAWKKESDENKHKNTELEKLFDAYVALKGEPHPDDHGDENNEQ